MRRCGPIEQAREIQEALVAENPDDLHYPNDLATSLANIGIVHAETGRADRALPLYEDRWRCGASSPPPAPTTPTRGASWPGPGTTSVSSTPRPAAPRRRWARWSGPSRSANRWSTPIPT